jgi:hypothetical protein
VFFSSWWRLRKRATSTLDRVLRNYLVSTKIKDGPARALAAQLEQTYTQVTQYTVLIFCAEFDVLCCVLFQEQSSVITNFICARGL